MGWLFESSKQVTREQERAVRAKVAKELRHMGAVHESVYAARVLELAAEEVERASR